MKPFIIPSMTSGALALAAITLGGGVASGFTCDRIDEWLDQKQNANIAQAVVWETDGGPQPWLRWPKHERSQLEAEFKISCQRLLAKDLGFDPAKTSSPLPNQKKLRDGDFATTILSPDDAKTLFLSYVAHSFALERLRLTPWSLRNETSKGLEILFDSRQYFEWDQAERGYKLNLERGGLVSPSAVADVFAFVKAHRIQAATRRDTLLNWLAWSTRLVHDVHEDDEILGHYARESTHHLERNWGFRGFPPVIEILKGTFYSPSAARRGRTNWTPGCWGTTGLFKWVLRTLNIPVELRKIHGHALPYFVSERVFLSHGDDPYNFLVASSPRRDLGKLLMDESRWSDFSGSNKPQIGFGPVSVAVTTAAKPLGEVYCKALSRGQSAAQDEVFQLVKRFFTLKELNEAKLWRRLDKLGHRENDNCRRL